MSSAPPDLIELAAQAAANWVRAALAPDSPIATQHWRGDGPVGELEACLRAHYDVPHALTMSSATNALLALGLALDLAEKEIIVPPNSYGATYGPFRWLGCQLVRADSDHDGNLCPKSVANLIKPSTAAVLATDYRGQPHDQRAIRALCDQHDLIYLSDAACTPMDAARDKRPASSLADAWIISFGMTKPVQGGEGAAVMMRDSALYRKLLSLTQHPERWRREVSLESWNEEPFLNARMHPLAAVLAGAMVQSFQSSPCFKPYE